MGKFKKIVGLASTVTLLPAVAVASTGGSGMVWDTPIQNIEQDLTGTIAHALLGIACVVTGLLWAFGEHGSSMRKVAGIAAGASVALEGASFVGDLGLSSGAVMGSGGLSRTAIAIGVVAAMGVYYTVKHAVKSAKTPVLAEAA